MTENESRIRVLSVIDGLGFAGDETRLLSMSLNLDRSRFTHSVLTLNPGAYVPAAEYHERLQHFRRAGVVVENLAEELPQGPPRRNLIPGRLYRKIGVLRRARRLARFVSTHDVDVIDARLESAGLVGALAGVMARRPASITMYGWHSPETRLAWPWQIRLAIRLAASVITDSRIRAEQMREFTRRRPSKVVVIPNGIARPQSNRSAMEMRAILGLPVDPEIRVIGQIGRLVQYKGYDVLIQSAHRVLAEEPKVAFLLVGYVREESYRAHLCSMTEQLGIADRVVITEYPDDIADVWKAIDIHAHASLFDSLPISIAEGMSLCKPAVVSDTGGIPEIVTNGQTGIIVPAGNPHALSAALLEVLRNPSLASRLAENAARRYEELYRPEVMLRALEQHFVMMASSRH